MVNVLRTTVVFTLATVVACGGTSTRNQTTTGDSGESVAGSGGSGVITGEPESCTTSAGELGMVVDIFPSPPLSPECLALNQLGDEDPSCPSDSLYVCDPIDCYAAVDMPGCCRPDGMCGLLEEGYFSFERKLGCVSRDPWLRNEEFLGRTLAPVSCTP
jgi:hypothetical protein